MKDETNDIMAENPDSGGKLPDMVRDHLRTLISDGNLDQFRDELPVEFLSDASEGLNHLKDGHETNAVLQQLNKQLHQQLMHKKAKRDRKPIGYLSWTYWAVILILIFAIASFVVIRMLLHHQ
jgi:hypothetical protein